MSMLLSSIKSAFRLLQLRRRFPHSVIHSGAVASIGSVLGNHSVLFRNATLMDSTLGAFSYVQSGSSIYNAEIGPFCSIAGGITIGLAAHPTSMVSTCPVFYDNEQPLPHFFTTQRIFADNLPRTFIGPDVWIGQGAMIKAGVRIGAGAVIGAGAIVTKDIAPYAIAVGNPCRTIRHRFPESICQRLLESHWWELDESRLQQLAPLFTQPELLLDELESAR